MHKSRPDNLVLELRDSLVNVNKLALLHQEVQLSLGTKHDAVSRSTKMESPNLLSLRNGLARSDGDFTAGDFNHADADEADETDPRVIGTNEDESAGGDLADERLHSLKRPIRLRR